MQKHKHAELMVQYAQDAMQTDEPWKLWEFNSGENWNNLDSNPSWFDTAEYRRKPKTIRIGNYDVPEPLRESPDIGSSYWHITIAYSSLASHATWRGDSIDMERLARGVIHSTVENAVIHAKAIISFTAIPQYSVS